jgi:UDP-N-acetyl-L-fucosamine synthase
MTKKTLLITGGTRPEIIRLSRVMAKLDESEAIEHIAVLSDSGTISEESSIMNFRALNIREAHECPEVMEEASVMIFGLNPERIMQCLVQLSYQKTANERNFREVYDYSMPNVSDEVVKIILSYTDYIRRTVWSQI